MHGAEYAWIILGDSPDSWKPDASGTECNDHQLMSAIQGVISVGSHYERVGNGTAVSEVVRTSLCTCKIQQQKKHTYTIQILQHLKTENYIEQITEFRSHLESITISYTQIRK